MSETIKNEESKSELTILIPVRDEGINLRIMIRVLAAVISRRYEIIVIYDNPDDTSVPYIREAETETPTIVRSVLNENSNGDGVASAIERGVALARSERVLIFLADDLGPVMSVDDMAVLMDEGCDFVSCTRYAHGGTRLGGSQIGKVLSFTANRTLWLFSGAALSDMTTGLKMFNKVDFPKLFQNNKSTGWSFAFDMAVNAQSAGLRLGEVPIVSIDRLYGGKSSMRLIPWIIAYSRFFMKAFCRFGLRPFVRKPTVQWRIPKTMN